MAWWDWLFGGALAGSSPPAPAPLGLSASPPPYLAPAARRSHPAHPPRPARQREKLLEKVSYEVVTSPPSPAIGPNVIFAAA
eukprot:6873046-Prymnesium_polylepis.1